MAEPIEDPTALVERQTIGGDRRAGDVAAKMLAGRTRLIAAGAAFC
jgi:hypothetical protein